MPYSIQTKDGITIPNIPDEWAPDDARLKQMVMQRRSAASGAAQQVPMPQAGLGTAPAAAPAPPPQAPMPPPQAAMPPPQAAPVAPPADEGSWLPAMQPSAAQPSVRPVPKKNAGEPNAQYQAIQMGGAALMHGIDNEMKQIDYRPGTANLVSQVLTPKDFEGTTNTDAYMAYQARAHGWIHGYLRLQSGQQVPEVEFNRYYHTFFPQPGEGEYVVKQKERLRQIAMDGVDSGLTRAQLDRVTDKLKESQARMGPPPKSPEARPMDEELPRQLGLTARAGIEGGLAMPARLANALVVKPTNKIAEMAGSNFRLPGQQGALSEALTGLGLPKPESALERFAGNTAQGVAEMGAGLGLAKAGGMLPEPAPQAMPPTAAPPAPPGTSGMRQALGLGGRMIARRIPGVRTAMNLFEDGKDIANIAKSRGLGRLPPDDIATVAPEAAVAPAARAAAPAAARRSSASYASPRVPDIVVKAKRPVRGLGATDEMVVTGAKRRARDSLGRFTAEK